MLPLNTRRPRRRVRFRPDCLALEGRELLTLMGNQLFPLDNAWNQKITNAPVAANSSVIIGNITSQYGNGRFWPDWVQYNGSSERLYGIPVNIVRGNSTPKIPVVVDGYPAESDLVGVPIPANPVLGGDYENRPNPDPVDRGDSHLLVYDADNNISYEMFYARRPSETADGQWHAFQLSVWDLKVNTFRTIGHTSADAAGLSILAGLARPDEALPVSQGGQGVINHALRMTLQNDVILDQFVYPASHKANPGNEDAAVMPPMGTRLRLKAGVDISHLTPQSKVVAQALKDYGLIVADNGSNFYTTGTSYVVDAAAGKTYTWDNDDIHDWTTGLKSLRYNDFEVVDLRPIVTGLSAGTGVAGDVITVSGQNFSGAAGRLSVIFGDSDPVPATFVNDTTLTVAVPAGFGTVDVFVQSGVDSGNWDNINAPIFGYGTSDANPKARFTYKVTNSASFTGSDTKTQGNWPENYGADGFAVIGATPQWPSYATVTPTNHGAWTWAASTSDVRAPRQSASSNDRVAATWFGSSVTVDVALSDGQPHPVSLYLLDYDRQGRSQKVEAIDPATGAVLDTRTLADFTGGTYLTWTVTGAVRFRVSRVAGPNAVLSGVFFGSPRSTTPGSGVTFVGADTTTQGNWQSAYGADGVTIVGDASRAPSYGAATPAGHDSWTWAASTADARALRKTAGTGDRVAATWYGETFTIDVNIRDGQPHPVSLYLLDYDRQGRIQQIDVLDPATGAVLDTRRASAFSGGTYLTWSLSTSVRFRLTSLRGWNAVVSGVFFGGAPTAPPPPPPAPPVNGAQFVGTDTTTQGNWQPTYGAGGYTLVNDAAQQPAATVTPAGQGAWNWAASTSDVRALRKPASASDRIAATWFGSTFTVDLKLNDGKARNVSLYLLDYDRQGRSQKVEVLDATTGAVIDTRTVSSFSGGTYLTWRVTGAVRFRFTLLGGPNAVLSGLFLGAPLT